MSELKEVIEAKLASFLLAFMIVASVFGVFVLYEKDAVKQDFVIGIVAPVRGMNAAVAGFIEGMKKYGFDEGRNVAYLIHKGKKEADDALKAMVEKDVDIIFTMTTPLTKKAKTLTADTHVPVVFIMHDPVASGVIDSLVKPGGNLTGVQVHGDTSKALEWLQIIVPDLKHIFVPTGQEGMASTQSLDDLQKAGRQLKVSVVSKMIKTKEELEMALVKMPENIDAIFALHSVLVVSNMDVVEKIALEKRLPIISLHQNKEATIMFGMDGRKAGIQVSRLANQILQGEKPADLPTELVDYHLGINLQKAQNVGLVISDEVLLQADNVIR